MAVEWRDPTPRRPRTDPLQYVAELRANPGRWALVATLGTKNSASSAAAARRLRFGPEFEVAARGVEVFARFIGGAK